MCIKNLEPAKENRQNAKTPREKARKNSALIVKNLLLSGLDG
jgi:hypothetical protein